MPLFVPQVGGTSRVSSDNSSMTPLASSATFTGEWEDVTGLSSVIVAVSTDQDGTFTIQFSPDGTNVDSTLTRYYRTGTIEAPHRFTITRQFMRVTFQNTSASTQTSFRLQTTFGEAAELNAPLDSNLARDFDAIATRPSSLHHEVARGLRQGSQHWNKFGYNNDVDTAAAETIWAQGGTFSPLSTARALDIVSSSTDDDGSPEGTGAHSLIVWGVDANRENQIEIVTLNGTTTVTTSNTWLGVNRMAVYRAGSGFANAGNITATAQTDATVQAYIPAGDGTSQQCVFFTRVSHRALLENIEINVLKLSGGGSPRVTFKGITRSYIAGCDYEVFRHSVDTGVENTVTISSKMPFVINESECFQIQAETDTNNTVVSARMNLIEYADVDA